MLKFTSIIAKHYNREDYASINDAAKISPELAKGNTKIWYAKDGYVRTYKHNDPKTWPDPNNLAKTHVLIGSIKCKKLDKIFYLMQGEIWSPNGEAYSLIKKTGTHTSMSVGDVIELDGEAFLVDTFGFRDLSYRGDKKE